MQKGITLFMVVYAILIIASGVLYALSGDNPTLAQVAGIGMGVLVFGLAFLAHRASGAIGNPFNGLEFGKVKHIIIVWLGGLLLGALAVGIAIGLGFVKIDPQMNLFLAMSAEQASRGGNTVSAEQLSGMKVFFQVISIVGAVIGPFLATAFICLAYFPVYGWLGRRLLVKGLPYTFAILAAYGMVGTAIAVLAPNPMVPEPNLAIGIPIAAAYGIALTAVSLWLFLVSNSVIVPALAFASFSAAFGAFQLYYAQPATHMVPPMGVADLIVLVVVAIALWLFGVPKTEHMEVAAVSFDGQSLTSEQLAAQATSGKGAAATPADRDLPMPDRHNEDEDTDGGDAGD